MSQENGLLLLSFNIEGSLFCIAGTTVHDAYYSETCYYIYMLIFYAV